MNFKIKGMLCLCVCMACMLIAILYFGSNSHEIKQVISMEEALSLDEMKQSMIQIIESQDIKDSVHKEELMKTLESFWNRISSDMITESMVYELTQVMQESSPDKEIMWDKKSESNFVSKEEWGEYLIEIGKLLLENHQPKKESIAVYDVDDEIIVTDQANYKIPSGYNWKEYENYTLDVIVLDNQIIFAQKATEEVFFQNVRIVACDGTGIETAIGESTKSFDGDYEEIKGSTNILADIAMKDGAVTQLRLKREYINGKILSVTDEFVEVEGFGKVKKSEAFRVFDAQYKDMTTEQLTVGNDKMKFCVADEKICAAIVNESVNPSKIRVLLTQENGTKRFFSSATFVCDSDYQVRFHEKSNDINTVGKEIIHSYHAGEVLTIDTNNEILKYSRITIMPVDTQSKIRVSSLRKNYGEPSYRGVIEVGLMEEGLVLINEVSIEEYLYSVVPSEMPSSYGVEALKVQAVCARSYAISHLAGGRLMSLGANVDDSTNYQVYNNGIETENSIAAVDGTKGLVMMMDGKIVTAYFYATSCGSTANGNVWSDQEIPYIRSTYLAKTNPYGDLSMEENFQKFINENPQTFDAVSNWYRWSVDIPKGNIETNTNVGAITNIEITKRGSGGIVEQLRITGTGGEEYINKQSKIRSVLSTKGTQIKRADGSIVDTLVLLPSAFITIDYDKEQGIAHVKGGGYGHGAGMSQTAVRQMIEEGMKYTDILLYFYNGVSVEMAECYLESER